MDGTEWLASGFERHRHSWLMAGTCRPGLATSAGGGYRADANRDAFWRISMPIICPRRPGRSAGWVSAYRSVMSRRQAYRCALVLAGGCLPMEARRPRTSQDHRTYLREQRRRLRRFDAVGDQVR